MIEITLGYSRTPFSRPLAGACIVYLAVAAFPPLVLAAQLGDIDQPDFKKTYAADFHPSLKSDKADVSGLTLFGPDASDCVKFTPAGLRITLPADYPRQRSGTGVVTDFGVQGDFEITVAFEIPRQPEAGFTGNPTDLKLVVVPNDRAVPEMWQQSNQNRAFLAREFIGAKSQFHADATAWNNQEVPRDKWGNELTHKIESHNERLATAKANSGRLRFVRHGDDLFFYTAEAPDDAFTLLHKSRFGTKDLKNVRILASTAWGDVSFDVLVTDLQIRADAFVKSVDAPAPQPSPPGRQGWWILAATMAALSATLVAVGLTWLYVRQSRPRTSPAAEGASPPAQTIVFECAGCGKRLKATAQQAGKTLKCPQCSKSVQVPDHPPEEAEEMP